MTVEASNLAFKYGDRSILRSLTLQIDQGEFVSIIGANGAGKTTLLKCLAGLHKPSSGIVRIAGRAIAGLSPQQLAVILAFVPQGEFSRFPMTVFDTVLLGRRPYLGWYPSARDLDVVSRSIERLGLAPLALRPLEELSGGERQKVSIARAIAQEPQVLLLDEPTTYLDLQHQVRVLDLLKELSREGITVVQSIHDLNLAFRVSDRIITMSDGDIVTQGDPGQVTSGVIRKVYGLDCEILEQRGRRIVIPL